MCLKQTAVLAMILLVLAGCQQQAVQSSSIPPAISSNLSDSSSIDSIPDSSPIPITPSVAPDSEISKSQAPSSVVDPTLSSTPEDSSGVAEDAASTEFAESSISQDAPEPIIEPSPESVILHIDKQQISLTDIMKNPDAFRVSGYILNNSTVAVGRSTNYSVERYDGEKWQKLSFSRDAMPNWETGSGDIEAGDKYMTGFSYWLFEEELIPGRYRFVMSSGPGFDSDPTLPGFHIYAEFELV